MSSEEANDEASDEAIDEVIDAASQGPAVHAESLPPASPDVVEQELGESLDNIVPTRGYRLTPTVGLGGSAGSIQALGTFFEAMPADSGLVFVVVLHPSPEHDSTLAELLARHTIMPVVQAEDGMVVQANHVYVIPPGKHLASVDGHLKLSPLESERGKRMAVDVFFRTLADTHGAHAAAVVLSGADGDGAIGIKRIKERGGLTVTQDPEEAEHEGMPRSAITTGMVDWVLKTHEIPPRLLEYFAREKRVQVPSEDDPEPTAAAPSDPGAQEAALREVLAYLHTRTGRDFSYYKRATVLRRIARRMQINGADTVAEYLTFLRTHPGESGALLQDLLISVTNFFRDRDAFTSLEAHIPQLFRNKRPSETVRVWCAACATGEEAYSVAMLLFEHARKLPAPPSIQVFATDLAEETLHHARDGVYPAAIATDVNEERLTRFFTKEHRGYRIRRELREAVLFAQHDLLKDSPFSRLDLVTCRNLLIYLNGDAQQRALDIFHFSLVHRGLLFLGTSESVNEADGFFVPLDKKYRLYAAQPTTKVGLPVPAGVSTLARALRERERTAERPVLPAATGLAVTAADAPSWPQLEGATSRGTADSAYLRTLARGGSSDLIVNSQHDILYLSGTAGRFLQLGAGELTRDLLHLVHPALRIELRAALSRAARSGQAAQASNLPIDLDGRHQVVDIQVTPVRNAETDHFVVAFSPRPATGQIAAAVPEIDPVAQQLEGELERLKRQLRAAQEQHEVSTEEQKAGNEELQAINEELRSASEELETSREELQAINEELTTVNQELKARVDELGHANSDLHNLMAVTNIATVFLDRELRIARYTPPAVALFNLIPTDVGRPLTDLKHQIDYPELEEDARRVLARLAPVEREVHLPGDGWFLARLQPYRSLDDHIAGVVLTFMDTTERKRAGEELRASEQRQTFLLRLSDALRSLTEPRKIAAQATRLLSEHLLADRVFITEVEADGMTLHVRDECLREGASSVLGDYRFDQFGAFVARELRQGNLLAVADVSARDDLDADERATYARVGIAAYLLIPLMRDGWLAAYLTLNHRTPRAWTEADKAVARQTADRTWTAMEHAHAEAARRESEEKYRTLFESIDEGFAVIDLIVDEHGKPVDTFHLEANPAYERHTGLHGIVGKRGLEVMPTIGAWLDFYGDIVRTGQARRLEYYVEPIGRWLSCYVSQVGGAGSFRLAVVFADITERKRREAHQTLLMEIGDDLSRLAMPDEIMQAVGERLGQYLKVSVCVFVDVFEERGLVEVHHGWNREGVPSLKQTFRFVDYVTEEFGRASRAGEITVVRDTGNDPRLDAEAYARLKIGATFAVPFHREGRWTAFLSVTDTAPRDWRGDEIELVHNIADRVFPRIERARAEEALRAAFQEAKQARSEAEAAGQAKDHFLAVLSHELRTPLMPINMALAVLGKREDLPEPIRKTHEMIRRNVTLETRFIDELLDVTRISSGKMEIVRKPLDLHEAIERAVEVSMPDTEAKGQTLTVSLEAAEHHLSGDFARLQQVFWNLLKNASKFTPRDSTIKICSRNEAADRITVEVTDTGIGMEAEALGRIFKPFEQANVEITREFGGLGLGLAIAKASVEAHGGTLRASSPGLNRGTTFTADLPLTASTEETAHRTE